MNWLEVTINASHSDMDALTTKLTTLGVEGIITEDEEDIRAFLEENRKYWDYVDEDYAASIRGVCRVKFYLEDSEDGRDQLRAISAAMPERELLTNMVKNEDWENNWKEFYKPMKVGEKLLIVPQWETAPEAEGRAVLRLDPGLIFGTGGHATTQMCLEALESYALPGTEVLDLGCGSGILAIAALLLGSDTAVGCDIDENAPPVVMENAALNGIGPSRLTAFAGDVLTEGDLSRRLKDRQFQVVTANIVADVIIAIAPKARSYMAPGGVFICSGIISGREAEVEKALLAAGFEIREHKRKEDWNAYICGGAE